MKKFMLIFGLIAAMLSTEAQGRVNPPAAVTEAFGKQFPGSNHIKWEKEGSGYEANFSQNGKNGSALFDDGGQLEETEWDIGVSELPKPVLDYLALNFKGDKVKEAAIIKKSDGVIQYEAELRGKDLMFSEKGELIVNTDYRVIKSFRISGSGGWDYLVVNGNNLYVSHGTQVNIINKNTGDSVGIIPQTIGIHGIAFDKSAGLGYTSNGRTNDVSVFRLSDNSVVGNIKTGENPDAIMYDEFSKKIITCNGKSNDLSVIDPSGSVVIATIPVGGKPETAVSDGAGNWFVNIEDKNEIVVVNASSFKVEKRWNISPGSSPTGLAYDAVTHELFAGCEEMLIVVDANTGKVKQHLPIGDGCDGVAYDADRRLIFTSNGEGTITILKENAAGVCAVLENIPTRRGARTITLDPSTHLVYTPTAEFEETPSAPNTRPQVKPGTFQVLVIGHL